MAGYLLWCAALCRTRAIPAASWTGVRDTSSEGGTVTRFSAHLCFMLNTRERACAVSRLGLPAWASQRDVYTAHAQVCLSASVGLWVATAKALWDFQDLGILMPLSFFLVFRENSREKKYSMGNTAANASTGSTKKRAGRPDRSAASRLPIVFGNHAEACAGSNKYKWRAFIRFGAAEWQHIKDIGAMVARVELKLHPTFTPDRADLSLDATGAAFVSNEFTGWGTFILKANVHWNPEFVAAPSVSTYEHMLNFTMPETCTVSTAVLALSAGGNEMNGGGAESNDDEKEMADGDTHNVVKPTGDERAAIALALQDTGFMAPSNLNFFHGRLGALAKSAWSKPVCTWASTQAPRDDHEAPEWLTASEYEDEEETAAAKCDALARLLRASKKTVVYSGAGISVAAGIGQAARGNFRAGKSTDAQPTFTHYALGALSKAGLLHGWVQQNHDGLPQKGGFPQENINEIHGMKRRRFLVLLVHMYCMRERRCHWSTIGPPLVRFGPLCLGWVNTTFTLIRIYTAVLLHYVHARCTMHGYA